MSKALLAGETHLMLGPLAEEWAPELPAVDPLDLAYVLAQEAIAGAFDGMAGGLFIRDYWTWEVRPVQSLELKQYMAKFAVRPMPFDEVVEEMICENLIGLSR